jgi:hypothetical protein
MIRGLIAVVIGCRAVEVWVLVKARGRLTIGLVVGYQLVVIGCWLLVVGC